MIKFYLVDVSSIQSNVPRSNFSEEQIEQLADMILECEGVLNVILLTQTGINQYRILEGDLEYYAAVRAKEKNLRQGEVINAVIVPPSNQDTLLKQADFLKNRSFPVQQEEVKVIDETSLESRSEKQLYELRELHNRDHRETNDKLERLFQIIASSDSQINNRLQQVENSINQLTANLDKPITQFIEKPTVTPPLRDPEYSDMTVAKLKEIAKKRNITGYSKMKKNQLIAILSQN
jgi:molybdenum cofactor biosynthesis enzyme MoaA